MTIKPYMMSKLGRALAEGAAMRRRGGMARITVCAAFGVCLSLLLGGCRQKELVYPASTMVKVSIAFEWDQAPEADPTGMSVVFYPTDADGSIWRFELPGKDGGVVSIPAGSYRMLAYNNDTRYIYYRDQESIDTFTAYTDAFTVHWPQALTGALPTLATTTVYRSPEELYCGEIDDLTVELCKVTYLPDNSADGAGTTKECPYHLVRCHPGPRTCNYTTVFRNVVNAESFRRGYTVLSGLSPTELIATDILSAERGSYVAALSRQNLQLSGSARAFGANTDAGARQYLYLLAIMNDGSVEPRCYDVTEQVANSDDPRNVIITIDGLEFPLVEGGDSSSGSTGFEVDINDWEEVVINITIG